MTDPVIIAAQVESFRHRKNLLLWYTSDEPDGPSLPLDTTTVARSITRHLDPYHHTALVLNCYDHHWTEYTRGTDIVLADVYSIAMNPIWSKKYGTEVTEDFGCSGCDECKGSPYDLPNRIDAWTDRARLSGRARTLPIWVVPQAFEDHGDEFWWRIPTGAEGAVQILLAFNHGAMGHCAWLASDTTQDLLGVSPCLSCRFNVLC